MQKITVRVGQYDGSEKDVVFTGELLQTQQEFDAPNDESRSTEYSLYRVPKGYRVFEKRRVSGQGQKRQNYAKLSNALNEKELLKRFPTLANYAGIFEKEDLDGSEIQKAILLSASATGTQLLPYTLANVQELIELSHFLLNQEDVPEKIKGEFQNALGRFEH